MQRRKKGNILTLKCEKCSYKIPHVYAIWICDFHVNMIGEYYDSWHIYSDKAVERSAVSEAPLPITEKVKYIVIDLKKFKKKTSELKTDEDRWLYLIKNAGVVKKLPKFNDEVLDNAVKRITVNADRDKKILEDQVACTISIDEQIGRMILAHNDGLNKGQEKATRKHVENALRGGKLSVEDIAEYNEVSVDYVRQVQSTLAK